LRGAWGQGNVGRLRACLSTLSAGEKNVRIDLEAVSHVDSAFLGLLMLLYGIQKQHGRRLTCESASSKVRRIFTYACCEFLLDEVDRLPAHIAEVDEVALEDTQEALRG
jgi:ABC-type transporter Mla MlaB component